MEGIDMNETLEIVSLEFAADVSGAIEETRISSRVVTSVVSAVAKVITDM